MSDAATALRDLLATELDMTAGTNIFTGPLRPAPPDEAVFCNPTGGPAPQCHCDGGAGDDIVNHSVQVTVRSSSQNYRSGYDLARSALGAAHKSTIAGYFGVTSQQADPAYNGQDEKGDHLWSFYVELSAKESL